MTSPILHSSDTLAPLSSGQTLSPAPESQTQSPAPESQSQSQSQSPVRPISSPALQTAYRRFALTVLGLDVPTLTAELRTRRRVAAIPSVRLVRSTLRAA
jgi:hypothetical protein